MKHLYRSRSNRFLCGICGGLGDYFRFDPTFFRLSLIFLTIFTALIPLILAYLIACFIIPLQPRGDQVKPYKRLYRSKTNRKLAGICGGVSELLSIDATLFRMIFIVLFFITGIIPLMTAYVIGWLIIPENPNKNTIISA